MTETAHLRFAGRLREGRLIPKDSGRRRAATGIGTRAPSQTLAEPLGVRQNNSSPSWVLAVKDNPLTLGYNHRKFRLRDG
jgi:hypothetical protein